MEDSRMNQVNVDEIVLLNPRNIDVAEGSKRVPFEAGAPIGMAVLYLLMVVMVIPQVYPAYQEKREHDAFVASSTITQATIMECYEGLFFTGRQVQFTYSLEDQTRAEAWADLNGSCDDYPAGAPLTIRYAPSDPSGAEGVDEEDIYSSLFYSNLLSAVVVSGGFLWFGWQYVQRLRYKRSAEVRQGHIVSIKPWPIPFFAQIRYEVPTDDGAMVSGKQATTRGVAKRLTPDSPIAILYADPKTHFVL
jgi:hypothetical protein